MGQWCTNPVVKSINGLVMEWRRKIHQLKPLFGLLCRKTFAYNVANWQTIQRYGERYFQGNRRKKNEKENEKMRVGQNHKKTERRRVPPLFFLPLIRWPNFYPHITDFGWHEPSKAFTSIRVQCLIPFYFTNSLIQHALRKWRRGQTADNTSVVVVFFDDEADIEPPGKK